MQKHAPPPVFWPNAAAPRNALSSPATVAAVPALPAARPARMAAQPKPMAAPRPATPPVPRPAGNRRPGAPSAHHRAPPHPSPAVVQRMLSKREKILESLPEEHVGLLVKHKKMARRLGVNVDKKNAATATFIFSNSRKHFNIGPYISGNPYIESQRDRLYPKHNSIEGEDNVDCAERKITVDGKSLISSLDFLKEEIILTIAMTSENTPCKKCEDHISGMVEKFSDVCSEIHLYIFSEQRYYPGKGKGDLRSTWKTTNIHINTRQFLRHVTHITMDGPARQELLKRIAQNLAAIKKREADTRRALQQQEKEAEHKHKLNTYGKFYVFMDETNGSEESFDEPEEKKTITTVVDRKKKTQSGKAPGKKPPGTSKTGHGKSEKWLKERGGSVVAQGPVIGKAGKIKLDCFLMFMLAVVVLIIGGAGFLWLRQR